jgi:hypothetical protein
MQSTDAIEQSSTMLERPSIDQVQIVDDSQHEGVANGASLKAFQYSDNMSNSRLVSGISTRFTRPHSFLSVLHEFDEELPPENEMILDSLEHKIDQLCQRLPICVGSVATQVNSKLDKIVRQVQHHREPQDCIAEKVKAQKNSIAIMNCLDQIHYKLSQELETGTFRANDWERELYAMEKRMKVRPNQGSVRLLFDRAEAKEIERSQAEIAEEFARKMVFKSKEHKRKREIFFKVLEDKTKKAIQDEILQMENKRKQALEQQKERALQNLLLRPEKKKARVQLFVEGERRQKEFMRKPPPLFIKAEQEFKDKLNKMYFIRGRNYEELEKFTKERKLYHLERNKRELGMLLNPPEFKADASVMREDRKSYIGSRAFSSNGANTRRFNSFSQDKTGITDFSIDNIKFNQLPKLTYLR